MRGALRWLAVLAVLAIVAVLAAFTIHRALAPGTFVIEAASSTLPADGFSSVEIKVRSSDGKDLKGLQALADNSRHASVESIAVWGDSARVILRSGVMPGQTKLHFTSPGFESSEVALQSTLNASDVVGDGTPDFLRLHDAADRAAFRRWFTLLAESEHFRSKSSAEIDDCAALLRYAYREALRQHDSIWAKSVTLPVAPTAGDVRQFQYPFTPLGAGLFRVREGSFAADDLNDGAFAQFADAKTLWRYNSYFVGRDVNRARPGDLLFFRQEGHDLPFHAMIFLGPSQVEGGSTQEPLVIYHTGPIGKSRGEIRRPAVAQLVNFPDPRWRPVPSNPSFLGVYRWNILRGSD
jgi:uncharacterized protein YfaT (DUF1175 family)